MPGNYEAKHIFCGLVFKHKCFAHPLSVELLLPAGTTERGTFFLF